MNQQAIIQNEIYYAKQDDAYILKFVGDIRCTISCALDAFLDSLFARRDFQNIIIDLRSVTNIDSTNLGLLAKIANFMRSTFASKPVLVSTSDNINQVLDSMGFDNEIFERYGDCADCSTVAQRIDDCQVSKATMQRVMLEAHTDLSNLSERNRQEFQGVIGILQRNMAADC